MLKLVALCLVAAVSANYYDYDDATRKGMLGARLNMRESMTQGVKVDEMTETEARDFKKSAPKEFHSATANPQCMSTINFIKDQAACGSCWAVAASSVLADRFCMKCGYGAGSLNNQNTNGMNGQVPNEGMPGFELSGEELMSCCRYCGDGCQGGYPIDAMRRAYITGYTSGGWFGSQCGCQAYKIAPVRQPLQPTPRCMKTCDMNNYPEKANMDRHKVSAYQYVRGESAIMKAIQKNGPVECAFTVYKGFEDLYRNPANAKMIYTGQGSQQELGGHAIKVVGWGQQMQGGSNVNFWLIHNSWNITWGDQGMFRFLRGTDLDGMEAQCVEATPLCPKIPQKAYESLQCSGRDFH